ncbi:MAG: hypothetical protein HQ519_00060 [Planctomycetes bacterium]|nr:hypothetical protein [Planctomycetota bacterium]
MGGVDVFVADVADHAVRMLRAVQVALGTRPADLSALDGGKDMGTVADAIFHLNRVQSGGYAGTTISSIEEFDAVTVYFDGPNRFTMPPMVRIQTWEPYDATNHTVERLEPRNVTKISFQLAVLRDTSGSPFASFPFTLKFKWFAIEPPFGFEEEDA